MIVKPQNAESKNVSRIIKANYFKKGAFDILDTSLAGAKYKATGVIIEYE